MPNDSRLLQGIRTTLPSLLLLFFTHYDEIESQSEVVQPDYLCLTAAGYPYYAALSVAAAHLWWQVAATDFDDRQDCYDK